MATSSKHEAKPLAERIQKARDEGRTQQALELTRQLAKHEPTAEHQQLLRSVIFERGSQLLRDGKSRDAIVVFENALALEAPPEFRAAIAAKLAQAGDVGASLRLFTQLPEGPQRAKAFAQAVDAALVKGEAGRTLLPADLHAGFDAILTAFAKTEKGDDDDARDALQAIGLSSPLLEWKVMLRGMMAYNQADDARALDNWQRLDPERQPWRLVAPFRFQIDAAFRDNQPPATATRLRSMVERLGSVGELATLRSIAKLMGNWDEPKASKNAFKEAREFIRVHGQRLPKLVDRLARIFYAKVAADGTPDEIELYRNTFPAPPDDPGLNRLCALCGILHDQTGYAIEAWLAYEKDVAKLKDQFPGESGTLSRALIWERLGAILADPAPRYDIPKRVPSAVECYRKSIALAPERIRPYQLLLRQLIAHPKNRKQAIVAAKDLVAKFPSDAETWEYLGDASIKDKKPAAAIEQYRSALKANPMHRSLRTKLADAVWGQGMKIATPAASVKTAPKPEKYRPHLEEAIRCSDTNAIARYAAWAIVEFRLGNADLARELIAKAEAIPNQRVALPLALHAASQVDKKLPDEHRAEHLARWHASLEQKPTPDEVLVALEALVPFDTKALRGKRDLVESLVPKLTSRPLEAFVESQLVRLGRCLVNLKMNPSARKVADQGTRRFPKNPHFQILMSDIWLGGPGGGRSNPRYASRALQKARDLALALPRESQESLIKEIEQREAKIPEDAQSSNSLFEMFARLGPQIFGDFEDLGDFDDDDEGDPDDAPWF